MRISTSICDITPRPGEELSGFLYRLQPSTGIHDPLYASAMYLEHESGRLLWLHADLIGLRDSFVQSFRTWALNQLGIEPHQLVISTTHTHSGPATVGLVGCGQLDVDYLTRLRDHLERLAMVATAQAEPVTMVQAEGHCDLAIDRRRMPSAHVDPRVGIVGFQRRDGSFAALLVNYAMHNVAMGHENRCVSGDIAGLAAATLRESMPGSPLVIMTAGAAANVNPPRTGVDFGQARAWADELALAVRKAIAGSGPDPVSIDLIRSARTTLQLPLVEADAAWCRFAAKRALAGLAGQKTAQAQSYRDAVGRWRMMIEERIAAGTIPRSVPVELQHVRLGSTHLLCVNAEIFSRLADDLRSATGQRLYVVGYANGLIGYVPTDAAFDEGGYEVESAYIFYGGLPVRRGGFEMIRDQAIQMLCGSPVASLAGSLS
jgi:neutral ceramidase